MRMLFALLLFAGAALAEPELPRVGTIGDEPPAARTIVLVVERDGTIRAGETKLSFPQMRQRLADAARRQPGANVLLTADEKLPWIAIQWVLAACAEAKIARLFHAARSDTGETGALALFVPRADAVPRRVPLGDAPHLELQVSETGIPVAPAALYFALRERMQGARYGHLEIRAPAGASYGFVLGLADAGLRAGAATIAFAGGAAPPEEADLAALVARTALLDAAALAIDGNAITPSARKMPPVERVRGRFAGRTVAGPVVEIVDRREHRIVRVEVGRALGWLAARQDAASGAWADTRATALALLAFLGAGYTDRGAQRENPFARNVRNGVRALLSRQAKDGGFGPSTVENAAATSALCSAYWMTRNPRYKRPSQLGLDWLARARNPDLGWGEGQRSGDDNTIATTWAVIALKTGAFGGLETDADALRGARAWVDRVTDPETGNAGYAARGDGVRPKEATAAALLTRVLLGERHANSAIVRASAARCVEQLGEENAYFGSLAMFRVGGARYRAWQKAIGKQVQAAQAKDGSWGGDVATTAMLTNCLLVHHRYDRVFGPK